jgi:hypothetical protein
MDKRKFVKAIDLRPGQHVWVSGMLMSFVNFDGDSPAFNHVAKHLLHVQFVNKTWGKNTLFELNGATASECFPDSLSNGD